MFNNKYLNYDLTLIHHGNYLFFIFIIFLLDTFVNYLTPTNINGTPRSLIKNPTLDPEKLKYQILGEPINHL